MADIIFLATIVAFFFLCVGYVSLCDQIIGPDEVALDAEEDEASSEAALERSA